MSGPTKAQLEILWQLLEAPGRRSRDLTSRYSYGGLHSALSKLHKQGLVVRHKKDGGNYRYCVTDNGAAVLADAETVRWLKKTFRRQP